MASELVIPPQVLDQNKANPPSSNTPGHRNIWSNVINEAAMSIKDESSMRITNIQENNQPGAKESTKTQVRKRQNTSVEGTYGGNI